MAWSTNSTRGLTAHVLQLFCAIALLVAPAGLSAQSGGVAASLAPSGSVWTGGYACAQGTTNATLTVVQRGGDRVTAIFTFAHEATRVGGAYWLHGSVNAVTREINWATGDWIAQPPDYMTVGLRGTVTTDGYYMSGVVTHETCGNFSLVRAR